MLVFKLLLTPFKVHCSIAWHSQAYHLELKTRPRFCPLGLSLSMALTLLTSAEGQSQSGLNEWQKYFYKHNENPVNHLCSKVMTVFYLTQAISMRQALCNPSAVQARGKFLRKPRDTFHTFSKHCSCQWNRTFLHFHWL